MESSGFMTCTLKLDTHHPGWHVSLLKVLRNIPGVKYSIDASRGTVEISGYTHPDKILRLLENAGEHVELLKLDSGFSRGSYGEIPNNMPSNHYDYNYGGYNHHGGYGGYGSALEPMYNGYSHQQQQPYYNTYYDHAQIAASTSSYHYPSHYPPLAPSLNPYYGESHSQCSIM